MYVPAHAVAQLPIYINHLDLGAKHKTVTITTTNIIKIQTAAYSFIMEVQPEWITAQYGMGDFRSAASEFPFAVRFQLERCLLSSKDGLETDDKRRRMLYVFIKYVLPSLEICDFEKADVENFTFCELFAEEIWEDLCNIKKVITSSYNDKDTDLSSEDDSNSGISHMSSLGLDISFVSSARKRALKRLHDAERILGTNEKKLTKDPDSIITLQNRTKWPHAEYEATFDIEGNFIPSNYEIVEKSHSRRALRTGDFWLVRDRFLRVKTPDAFEEPWTSHLLNSVIHSLRASKNRNVTSKSNESSFQLCNRDYAFLFEKGMSRKIKLWFLSPIQKDNLKLDRHFLLTSLGNFDGINPYKVSDRISLAFTKTVPVLRLETNQILAIPDISHEGYDFSDGCGIMGTDIAKEIQKVMMNETSTLPSAAQIRIGGVKGMLSLCIDESHIPSNCIGVRSSQVKFKSNHFILEVKRVAKAIVSGDDEKNKLMRHALLVLDHLGVPCSTLYNLQEKAAVDFALKKDKADALDSIVLKKNKKKLNARLLSKEKEYLQNYVLSKGIKADGTPFTANELCDICQRMITARTKVNINCNVSLLQGVVDEYGCLVSFSITVIFVNKSFYMRLGLDMIPFDLNIFIYYFHKLQLIKFRKKEKCL